MSHASARYVVDMVEDHIEHMSDKESAATMIFLNRLVRNIDLKAMPRPKDKITILDVRRLCGQILLEHKRLPERANDERFCHYLVGRFHNLAGKHR